MILIDDGFWVEFEDGRIVSIAGRLGAGKTLLALEFAERMLRRGYRLLTNVPCVWSDTEFPMMEDGARRTVVVVDEGGLYLRTMRQVTALASFARKLDLYVIVVGRREPHAELCELMVRPFVDLRRNFGIPVWIWRWENLAPRRSYGGYIVQAGRSGFYGTFDTVSPGASAEVVLQKTSAWSRELFEMYGYEHAIPVLEAEGGPDSSDLAVDELASATRRLSEIVAIPPKSRRRRF